MSENPQQPAPPAQGRRQQWEDMPETVRVQVEAWLGSRVVASESQLSGFSPGVAARLQTETGRTLFLKAAGSELNPRTPDLHRHEAEIMRNLPLAALAPELLWVLDDRESGWVVLIFAYIDGSPPAMPWQPDELQRVLHTLDTMATALKVAFLPEGYSVPAASTLFKKVLHGWQKLRDSDLIHPDPWVTRHLPALCELETYAPAAVTGQTLVHFDIRADNMLLTDEKVWILDWSNVCVGADWLDVILFAPSVRMQGGPKSEALIQMHPACQKANPDEITAAVAAMTGFFTYKALLPPSPGLPSLPEFFNAQGMAAREWLRERTGWA